MRVTARLNAAARVQGPPDRRAQWSALFEERRDSAQNAKARAHTHSFPVVGCVHRTARAEKSYTNALSPGRRDTYESRDLCYPRICIGTLGVGPNSVCVPRCRARAPGATRGRREVATEVLNRAARRPRGGRHFESPLSQRDARPGRLIVSARGGSPPRCRFHV